jgi:CheY-like chemotaxis protein
MNLRYESRLNEQKKWGEELTLRDLHVLVVDDCNDNQILIKRFLQRAGAHVQLAENGKMGVEAALHDIFDAVVMDIQMPVMDGISATQSLRARGYDRPILALTAHGQRGDRERSWRWGFSDFLGKPISAEALVASIARLTSGSGV